jgi:hypothetical protein
MKRLRTFLFWSSLVGLIVFLRAQDLVRFAVGYGIREADPNLVLFRCAAMACGLVAVGTGIAILMNALKDRRTR